MDSGVAAILGAIVGGVVPGGIAVGRSWSQHRRTRRALLRVVYGRLATIEMTLQICLERGQWWPNSVSIAADVPYEDRKLLAETLSPKTWNWLDNAFQMIDMVSARRAGLESLGLGPNQRQALTNLHLLLTRTQQALRAEAGDTIIAARDNIEV